MEKFGESQSVTRFEDVRFLTGHGRYMDDVAPEGALHIHFLRSTVAHGDIVTLDTSAAREAPGVHLVLTAGDLEQAGVELGMKSTTVRNRDGSKGAAPFRPVLATDRVRFVGEPVVAIVADSEAEARDAAETVELEIDEREPHMELAPGGPPLHDEAPENVAFDWALGDADATEAAFAAAAHSVSLDLVDNRVIPNSMEPRGCYAEWDGARLHVCFGGQGVWGLRDDIAAALSLDPAAVQVTTPDVGGGFGTKAMNYPEYFVIAAAARMLGGIVHWVSERSEAMMTDNAGRDVLSTAEMAFDENLRITGYRVHIWANLGAYNSQFGQPIQSQASSRVLTGTYDVPAAYVNARGIYTNTAQTDAYRGAGRPEAIYTLERTIDHAAHQFGVSPWDLRRRNFIPPEAFPYRTVAGETYDVGDFHRVLDRVQTVADVDGFAGRKAASAAAGKLRGLGLCYYIEAILGDPTEDAEIEFAEDGRVLLYVGTQSNGQGHETVYAQFLSDRTGIPVAAITVVQGDSDRIARGGGTGGSRSVTTQSAATQATVEAAIAAFRPFLAGELGVEESAIAFEEGRFRAEGSNRTPTLLEAAEMARAAGRSDLQRHHAQTTLPGRSFPNGAHVCEVEIDPETGTVTVPRYTVTDDFGNLMNPQLAEGQVHGGVAQGLGQAVSERTVYDETGQLLTATFMDYAMPRADTVPSITFSTEPVPSTANPLGMKGCGEAGTVGALAAVANGVLDAVRERGVQTLDMPFTPHRVWSMLNTGAAAAE